MKLGPLDPDVCLGCGAHPSRCSCIRVPAKVGVEIVAVEGGRYPTVTVRSIPDGHHHVLHIGSTLTFDVYLDAEVS